MSRGDVLSVLGDIRYAVRGLGRSPGFTLVSVATLALGIGANTAIFSLVDAVLFRPLPARDPDALVRVFAAEEKFGGLSNSSYPVYEDYRDQSRSFDGLAAYSDSVPVHFSASDARVERITGALVTGNFFDVLGVAAGRGRVLTTADDRVPGAHPVVVLGDRLWKRRFGSEESSVGSLVRINGQTFTVVGIAPPGFVGVSLDAIPEVWMPMSMAAQAAPDWGKESRDRRFSWLDMVGRLKYGVTLEPAQAELTAIAARRASAQPEAERDPYPKLVAAGDAVIDPYRSTRVGRLSWLLEGVAILVLLIACADAAGLLLVRAERRGREIAIRSSLGASRGRLVRLLLTESILLSTAGALGGLLVAAWTTDLLARVAPPDFPIPIEAVSAISHPRVLAFTATLAFAVGILFGLAPAARASGGSLGPVLRAEGWLLHGRSRRALGDVLSAAQVALAVILLVGAGLLLKTAAREASVDPGFEPRGALVASLDLARQGYSATSGSLFYERLLEGVRALPQVRAAALARVVPVQSSGMRVSVEVDGYAPPPGDFSHVDFNIVTPAFFEALKAPIVRGREFTPADRVSAPKVAIVNEAMARRFWPRQDALGKRIRDVGPASEDLEVVGVARDIRYRNLREPATPILYVPLAQFYISSMTLLVRTTGEPGDVVPSILASVVRLDRDLPLFRVRTLSDHLGMALAQNRLLAGLIAAFGLLALLLAGAGLYGVLSHRTQARLPEFGVRMALGAGAGDLLRLVLVQGTWVLAAGLLIGLAGALALSPLASSLLFGVTPWDPGVFAGAATVLTLVSFLAAWFPAQRATRVDPMTVLRSE